MWGDVLAGTMSYVTNDVTVNDLYQQWTLKQRKMPIKAERLDNWGI
jgi:hypothetical protein